MGAVITYSEWISLPIFSRCVLWVIHSASWSKPRASCFTASLSVFLVCAWLFSKGERRGCHFSWIELIGRTKAFLLRIICKWICKENCSRDPSRGRVLATIFAGISEKEEFTWALTVTMRA